MISVSVVVGMQLSDDDDNNVDQEQSIDLAQHSKQNQPVVTHENHPAILTLPVAVLALKNWGCNAPKPYSRRERRGE